MITRFPVLAFYAILFATAGLAVRAEPGPASSSNVSTPFGSSSNATARFLDPSRRAEQIRTRCIEGRRFIAGRVVQVTTDGLVVDSGYSQLLSPPFNHSWVVRGTASVTRDPHAVEAKKPDAVCVGLVLLSNIPKRPPVKLYDYVVLHGYPAGEHAYVPVAGVEKTIRRFSASLERAVELNQEVQPKSSVR